MSTSFGQIEDLLRQLADLETWAVEAIEDSPLSDDKRRQEVGAVHAGAADIMGALETAQKAYQTAGVPASEQVERLLAKLIEATRSSDIAKIPTPFKKKRDYTKPQKEYLSFFARTSYLPGTQMPVERKRGACA